MQMYPDQFDKIGSMPGADRLSVNKNIHPHIDAPRKIPIALKDYIKQFIPNLADKTHTLQGLLKKDTPFLWEEHHKECFEKLKTVISQDSTLTYFHTTEIPVLQTDASLKGLGAAQIQNKKPIAYASKSLTDAENGMHA